MTMTAGPRRIRSLREVLAMPILLGVLSAIGLVVALLGDDIWDAVGWIGLGIPLLVAAYYVMRPVGR
jgi:hypothetical protein